MFDKLEVSVLNKSSSSDAALGLTLFKKLIAIGLAC
jgi:hypothetical protein